MKSSLSKLLPSPTVTVSLLSLPIVLTLYFVITKYSQDFVIEQDLTYLDVQNNWLGQVLVQQSYLEWFNRFMDFAFWGVLALVVIVGVWAVGAMRISFKNHFAQEDFVNFKENKASWHGNFFIVLLLRIILGILILYSFFAIAGRYIPLLSVGVSELVAGVRSDGIQNIVVSFAAIFGYQYLIAVTVKIFKYLRAE